MQTHFPLFSCRKPLIDYSCLSYTFNLGAFSSYLWLTIWHMRARVTFIHPLLCFHLLHPYSHPPSIPLLSDGQQKPVPRTDLPAMIWLPKDVQNLPLLFPSQCGAWSKINYTDRNKESWHHLSQSGLSVTEKHDKHHFIDVMLHNTWRHDSESL